jgi:hypothetical protein
MITTWTTLLLTGLRGNGKTLMAVEMMDQFIKAGVPVFASNFNELTLPGVQFLDDPNHWRELPPGSVLFVDEAQRFWRSRRSGDPPQAIIEMETQRHDAVRIVLLTQQPTYLDKHLRGLVDVHRHLVRRAGLEASQLYEWERIREEWDTPAAKDEAEASIFAFPKQYYGTYKSADEHTIKRKLPMRAKLILAAIPLIAGLMWYSMQKVKPGDAQAAPVTADAVSADVSAVGDTPADPRRRRSEPLSPLQYLERMQARIPGAPWSAPIFDEVNEPQEAPEVYCMIGRVCHCLTEQGTRYPMAQLQCRNIVHNGGIWNPFKRKRQDEMRAPATGVQGATPAAMDARASAPSSGTVLEAPQVSGYGDIGVGKPVTAPETGS